MGSGVSRDSSWAQREIDREVLERTRNELAQLLAEEFARHSKDAKRKQGANAEPDGGAATAEGAAKEEEAEEVRDQPAETPEERHAALVTQMQNALESRGDELWDKLRFVVREVSRLERKVAQAEPDDPQEGDHVERSAMARTLQSLRDRHKNRFVVSVDGSDHSHKAFETVMNIMRRNDKVKIFHAYRPTKEPAAPHFHADAIRERYEVSLVSRMADGYSFHWESMPGDKTTKETIVEAVNNSVYDVVHEDAPSWFVSGFVGRKGPKADPSVLGTVADLALRSLHLPCIVVKNAVTETSSVTYVMAVDHSQISRNGFDLLLTLVRPRDSLLVLHVVDDNEQLQLRDSHKAAAVRSFYEAELADRGPVNAAFHEVNKGTKLVHEVINVFVEEQNAQFVCMAPRAKQSLSSVTEHVVKLCPANVVILKN